MTRDDTRIIHTDGLEEGIRCAMCTNPMANDRGCDSGCDINESMYKRVLDVIKKNILEQEPCEDEEYEKDLNWLKEQILKEGNTLISKQDLLERFVEIDNEYKNSHWNLLQILTNIDILIGKEPCEDAVSRTDVLELIEDINDTVFGQVVSKGVMNLPSVNPQEQKWIPVSERLPTKEEYIANNGLFIVSDGNRNYAEYFDVYDSKKFGEFIVFGFRVDKCVIAWMPLPVKPYKAESEEEK